MIILEYPSSSHQNRQWESINHDPETSGPTRETPGCNNDRYQDLIISEYSSSCEPNRPWESINHDPETSGPTLETQGYKKII